MVRKILEEKIITIPEVKEILDRLMNQLGKEFFDTFQEATLNFCGRFAKVEPNKVESLRKMLMKDYDLDAHYSAMIINIFPETVEELRVIFEKHPKFGKLSDEELQEIVLKIQDLK